ncbi:hypothetical protein JCM13664_09270 [Methylothermus subterraneus]
MQFRLDQNPPAAGSPLAAVEKRPKGAIQSRLGPGVFGRRARMGVKRAVDDLAHHVFGQAF